MTLAWVWRTGKQYVGAHQIVEGTKIISAHWGWEGSDEVFNVDWGLKKQCDKKLLKVLIKEMEKADEIIYHNGDRFDLKWVRSRAMFHGLEMLPSYKSIDTYKIAKSYLNLPSYSLKEICKYYGLTSKLDSNGAQTWYDVQFNKSQEALDHLLYYGDGDITSLKEVFYKFNPYIKRSTHYSVLSGGDKWECPECTSNQVKVHGNFYTAMGTQQKRMKCKSCGITYKISMKSFTDYLQWKIKDNQI